MSRVHGRTLPDGSASTSIHRRVPTGETHRFASDLAQFDVPGGRSTHHNLVSLDLQVSNCRLQYFRGDAQYLVAGILRGGKDGRPHRIGRLTPAGTTTVRHGIGIIMYDVHRLR